MLDGEYYYTCICGSPDHTLRFILDLDPEYPTLYTELMMSHYQPWYKRVHIGIKYMFGMDTVDHYGCWEIKHEDVDKMIELLTRLKNVKKKEN